MAHKQTVKCKQERNQYVISYSLHYGLTVFTQFIGMIGQFIYYLRFTA